mgnify:CR=1 FL=1
MLCNVAPNHLVHEEGSSKTRTTPTLPSRNLRADVTRHGVTVIASWIVQSVHQQRGVSGHQCTRHGQRTTRHPRCALSATYSIGVGQEDVFQQRPVRTHQLAHQVATANGFHSQSTTELQQALLVGVPVVFHAPTQHTHTHTRTQPTKNKNVQMGDKLRRRQEQHA